MGVASGSDLDANEHGQWTLETNMIVNLWFREDLTEWQRIAKGNACESASLSVGVQRVRSAIEFRDRRKPQGKATAICFYSLCRAHGRGLYTTRRRCCERRTGRSPEIMKQLHGDFAPSLFSVEMEGSQPWSSRVCRRIARSTVEIFLWPLAPAHNKFVLGRTQTHKYTNSASGCKLHEERRR